MKIGDIIKVRVIGSFGLIDQGEIDWKVFGLIENEAERLNVKNSKYSLKKFKIWSQFRLER